ncbi:TPA: hypothetical protein L3645_006320 [Pseudomonas aeruginosa]|nr:hypothetical protein [Pseudomonas aeruginosa]
MSDVMMDLKAFYAGKELKCYVVEIEAGPRRRPTHKSKHCIRASSADKAREGIRNLMQSRVRGARYSVRYAHPVIDLRLTKVENFTPVDPDAPLPDALRSTRGMYRITCRCGHSSDFDDFCTTPSGAELPRNEYQCPRCYKAWRVQAVSEGWRTPEGLYIPPDRKCVAIPPRP